MEQGSGLPFGWQAAAPEAVAEGIRSDCLPDSFFCRISRSPSTFGSDFPTDLPSRVAQQRSLAYHRITGQSRTQGCDTQPGRSASHVRQRQSASQRAGLASDQESGIPMGPLEG